MRRSEYATAARVAPSFPVWYRCVIMRVDGNTIAKKLEREITKEFQVLPQKKVCFIVFGNNKATKQFVEIKSRTARRIGVAVVIKKIEKKITTEEARAIVRNAANENYDGIVVQLPLFRGIDTQAVLDEVPREKDIDMLGLAAKKLCLEGKTGRLPPVAAAVLEIFSAHHVDFSGKQILVIGAGRLVGEPVSILFQKMNIPHSVIDAHTDKKRRAILLKNADIIISGIGVARSIAPEMVKDGVIVIDAGTSESTHFVNFFRIVSRVLLGRAGKNAKRSRLFVMSGDADPSCEQKASLITPVPGGVGPITVVCLLRNLLR